MTPEERKRFIEEEKAHLRKLRALKAAARRSTILGGAQRGLASMVDGLRKTLDTHGEFVDRLDRDSATSEARTEMILEEQTELDTRAAKEKRADALLAQFSAEEADVGVTGHADDSAQKSAKTIGRMPRRDEQ